MSAQVCERNGSSVPTASKCSGRVGTKNQLFNANAAHSPSSTGFCNLTGLTIAHINKPLNRRLFFVVHDSEVPS